MNELTSAINQHLATEFQAGPTDLALSIWLREKDLAGFSAYMPAKSQEERDHAARMIACLADSGEQVELPTIEAPERSWPSVQTLFDQVYDKGKGFTASINHLYAIAETVGERSATARLLLDQPFLEGTALTHVKGGLSGARAA
ncbi:ferritin-like domain-containing protein [Synechococcus sp. CS-1332]|uniref:ferritin-like domain-containing protein n=1 Tax=Synechococcus sp. CS-1332 TaxID=2847972 RepID=UPI00223A846B|nr:ferritin-like domain-containing protein [Synechococcus sp. CS-1332]MCT0207531.1 ferritin [Synechococcus sp. CS-1332]